MALRVELGSRLSEARVGEGTAVAWRKLSYGGPLFGAGRRGACSGLKPMLAGWQHLVGVVPSSAFNYQLRTGADKGNPTV